MTKKTILYMFVLTSCFKSKESKVIFYKNIELENIYKDWIINDSMIFYNSKNENLIFVGSEIDSIILDRSRFLSPAPFMEISRNYTLLNPENNHKIYNVKYIFSTELMYRGTHLIVEVNNQYSILDSTLKFNKQSMVLYNDKKVYREDMNYSDNERKYIVDSIELTRDYGVSLIVSKLDTFIRKK